MHRNHPTPDNEHPGRRRQLEKSVSWSGRERLRCLWYRLRLTVAEMNYAAWRIADPRVTELQAPLISDDHPSRLHGAPGNRPAIRASMPVTSASNRPHGTGPRGTQGSRYEEEPYWIGTVRAWVCDQAPAGDSR
jgi:hypothetical protein